MYSLLQQQDLDVPRKRTFGPMLGSSLLTALDRSVPFRGHAIKYVLRGEERYTVNGRPFVVKSDHYLLGNPHCQGRVTINSTAPVAGLCADLPCAFIDGMVAAFTRPDDLERDTLDRFFNSAEFLENACSAKHTRVGATMRRLAQEIHEDPYRERVVPQDLYLSLAEAYVSDHRSVVPLLGKVKGARASTRKEMVRGLERARALIHDHYGHRIDVKAMAQEAAMSEFHFFRAFREAHGTTPHRYLHEWRLQQAAVMLTGRGMPIADVALRCGFADGPAFSKAFKKRYGTSPSGLQQGSRRF